jgi:GT2 family glycosyltransferase
MIRLCTVWYDAQNPARQRELQDCLRRNLDNPHIGQVCLWQDSGARPGPELKLSVREENHPPTFTELFALANAACVPGDVAIIANSDIWFDDTAGLVEKIGPNQCYALLRRESDGRLFCSPDGKPRPDSQDAWVFRAPLRPVVADFNPGRPRCDNALAHRLWKEGYELNNPAHTIHIHHAHASAVRLFNSKQHRVPRPWLYLEATNLEGRGRLTLVRGKFRASEQVRPRTDAVLLPAPNEGPLLTVAICTRNRAAHLERAIHSVLPQITDDTELLIVDNASTDRTGELLRQLAAAHRCVTSGREEEIGLCAARNTALAGARGRYVLFLDDDATVEPGWLRTYQRFLSAPPSRRIAVVGGAVFPEPEILPPEWLGANEGRLELGPVPACFPDWGGPWECNCAYLRTAALQAGRFDLRLGHKGEAAGYRDGADLNLRLQEAGYEVWWLPGAAIRHVVHAHRLNWRWALRSSFNDGRSVAIQRLNGKERFLPRLLFGLGRLGVAPFHCGINLLGALGFRLLGREQSAMRHLRGTWRIAGLTWELLARCGRAAR